jgi:hypothetical protein
MVSLMASSFDDNAATPYHFRESGLLEITALPRSNAEFWVLR